MNLTEQRAIDIARMMNPRVAIDDETGKKKQRDLETVMLHLVQQARKHQFRKRGSVVYMQKRVDWKGARYGTHAWIPAIFGSRRGPEDESTMESFVLFFCRRDMYPDMWDSLVRSGPATKKVAEFLSQCDDEDFPFVHSNRNLLAFKNGIYNTAGASCGSWHEYGPASETLGSEAASKERTWVKLITDLIFPIMCKKYKNDSKPNA